MNSLRQQINQARPPLRAVAPLTSGIVLTFGLANLVMGSGMWWLQAPSLLITSLTPWKLWAVIYFIMGLVMLYGHWRNDWGLMRGAMIVGVLVKLLWWVGVVLSLQSPGGVVIFGLWTSFMVIQILTYVFFIPNRPAHEHT